MLRRRKHGTTGRLALPHQHRQKGEIAETVRSAPGRDPRMARFIRIFSALARLLAGAERGPGLATGGGEPVDRLTYLFVYHTNNGREGKMAPKSVQTAPEMPAGDPKHAARATRSAGRQMRSRLLDGASRLFKERGLAGTSISDIAAAADAFPSQITYYFRTKEALVRRSRLPRHAVFGARGRAGRVAGPHAAGIHARAGRDRHGDGFGRLLYRSAHAHPPPPGSRAAGGAHHRAAARRGHARLCRPDRATRLENLARSRRELTAVLGARDRRDGRGPCHGPFGGRNVQRDAARAGRSGDDKDRRRQYADCVWSATATLRIHPTGRDRHDRASHACPRLPERGSIDRRAPARDLEGRSPDRACVGADIGIDRAGRLVAQSADLFAGGRHHRLAPARACDPDA